MFSAVAVAFLTSWARWASEVFCSPCSLNEAESSGTQTFQNPLIKEYTLNYNMIPNMI